MSLLSRERIRIAVCPDRVALLQLRTWLRSRVENKTVWECARSGPDAPLWRPAIEALRLNLPSAGKRPIEVSVVLSSHFCQFSLLNRNEQLRHESELAAYAQHKFRAVYGEASNQWVLKPSSAGREDAFLISAIEQGLIESLREVMREKNLTLVSVQPYFAIAFNRARKTIGGATGWFVVPEDGRVVVGLLGKGQWKTLASRRAGKPWTTEVFDLLDREKQLLGLESNEYNRVLIYAPQLDPARKFADDRYHVELLGREEMLDLSMNDKVRYAMAA